MSITDQPEDDPTEDPTDEVDDEGTALPNRPIVLWQIVQALRKIGRAATIAEIADHVADSLELTQQQRTVMIQSGQRTKIENSIMWAALDLKNLGVVHYPKPGYRELTDIGLRVDDEQLEALRIAYQANKSSSGVDQPEGPEQTDAPTAWLIRAGRDGDRYDYNIEHGLACLGWDDVPDLRGFSSRQELRDALRLDSPDSREGTISNHTSQLWRMRTDVRSGDLVVMPRKGARQIALGVVTREYWHDSAADMGWGRHVVSVDWKRTDVPRTALKQDLVGSLSAQMTICSITRNDASRRFQQLMETGQDPGAPSESGGEISDPALLVEQFHAETGYPTEAHEEQRRLRTEWAEKLAPENIARFSRLDLTAVASHGTWSSGMYVYPSVRGVMKWIKQMDDTDYARTIESLRYLCWDKDELSVRYDNLLDPSGPYRIRGLADETTSRTLAICHPDVFLPIGKQTGKWGRERMLHELGLPDAEGLSHGERIVDANNRLREHLEPHFGDDALAMGAFLGWLLQQEPSESPMDLTDLADELLVGAEFLADIVSLLKDKGQVILYGPPGTGKTYLARKLAATLAPDESCRALVQFHPSTSYEDFFEGYRPAGTDGRGIHYELTSGPLARMAQQADGAREQRHVMIIDEINRGNLPRVLGELLFLLEYRDESVNTLYRPDEPFSLPENLWFIGTMNTADRSIALVDAALRRRFHFVPFFPDRGPMAGLLSRWLQAENEPDWVGRLVDAVNDELKAELEGSHLLIGPSHFMKEYGSPPTEQHQRLRRIWEYNIEPFIEDQFFGDPVQIERFRFKAVMDRLGPPSWRPGDTADDLGPPGDDEATDDKDAFEEAAEAVGADDAVEAEST